MSRKIGMLVTCNRCGRTCFRPQIGDRGDYFKTTEKGWSYDFSGPEGTIDFCPHCAALKNSINKRFLAGKSVSIPALNEPILGGNETDGEE